MAKAKSNYTENQGRFARWIVSGRKFNNTHDILRGGDPILLHYALNPLAEGASHWYKIVRDGDKSKWVTDEGNGLVEVVGNGGPSGYTQTYHSSYGITIRNTQRAGRKPNGKGHHRYIIVN